MAEQKFHVNPTTGGVSSCGAEVRDCPWKDSTPGDVAPGHYADRETAAAAAEKMLADRYKDAEQTMKKEKQPKKEPHPEQTKAPRRNGNRYDLSDKAAAGYAQQDLRVMAGKTSDPAALKVAARSGDESVLRAVANNPNTDVETLNIVQNRATNDKTLDLVKKRLGASKLVQSQPKSQPKTKDNGFHPREMSSEQLNEHFGKYRWKNIPQEWIKAVDTTKDEATVQKMIGTANVPPQIVDAVVSTKNPNIGVNTRMQALKKAGFEPSVYGNENFPINQLGPHMDNNQLETYVRHTGSARGLSSVGHFVETTLETSDDAGKRIQAEKLAMSVYRNPASSADTKQNMADATPRVASLKFLDEIQAKDSEGFKGLYLGAAKDNGDHTRTRIQLDRKKIKELGLSHQDVEVMVNEKFNARLGGGTYDARSGVFSGFKS